MVRGGSVSAVSQQPDVDLHLLLGRRHGPISDLGGDGVTVNVIAGAVHASGGREDGPHGLRARFVVPARPVRPHHRGLLRSGVLQISCGSIDGGYGFAMVLPSGDISLATFTSFAASPSTCA